MFVGDRAEHAVGGMPAGAVVVFDPASDRVTGLFTSLEVGCCATVPIPGSSLNDSATALSRADPVRPIDCVTPASRQAWANSSPVYSVLARTHQSLIWARTRHANMLRSGLREYYPAALEAFDSLTDGDALAVLGRAPTPEQGARLSLSKIGSALKAAGRQRNIDKRAVEIQALLRLFTIEGSRGLNPPVSSRDLAM